LARFYGQVLPADIPAARRITYLRIQQLGQRAGLRVSGQGTDLKRPLDDEGRLTKYTMNITLTGSYRGIRQLIHSIETQPAFTVIENIELATDSGPNDPLSVTLRLATYFAEPHGG
ncbi:MAG: type II secretion system protein M, partial [Acidobacteriota bacterium]|nr:type II secretion system protein M [Acidobacteriota bacterium]